MCFILGSWCTTATSRAFSYIHLTCALRPCPIIRFDYDAIMTRVGGGQVRTLDKELITRGPP